VTSRAPGYPPQNPYPPSSAPPSAPPAGWVPGQAPSSDPIVPVTGRHLIATPGTTVDDREAPMGGRGDLTQELIDSPVWTDEMVHRAGIPVVDVPLVTIGAGIGSFQLILHLRIAGVPTSAIAVLGVNDLPWQTYEYLTRVSQIPRGERLRSDSGSTPDNIWGFPSYALREAWHGKKGRVATA
jgi:hypothetical protein